ncbi:MAG: hypothetical protein MJB57_10055 [Gemmatimonadetes bacterium]|nr:hypothetical protein [Gemmatimonadota bacterium]
MDPTQLLTSNLLEAFAQLNRYLGVGLVASVSALTLERAGSTSKDVETVTPPGGFPPMTRESAQLVLVGVAFVAGLMGSYAAESASGLVQRLASTPEILAAACTFPSAATAPVGVPVIAAALPILFVGLVCLRKWRQHRESGILTMLGLFAAAYAVLGVTMAAMPCRAS